MQAVNALQMVDLAHEKKAAAFIGGVCRVLLHHSHCIRLAKPGAWQPTVCMVAHGAYIFYCAHYGCVHSITICAVAMFGVAQVLSHG